MILLKNGYIVDPKSKKEGIGDILINEDKIKRILFHDEKKEGIPVNPDVEVIDVEGLTVAPGLVDVHVHFRDPGFPDKEDIYSGAKAAAKGGFTTVVMMANTNPVGDSAQIIQSIVQKGKETGIHIETCGTVRIGMKGEQLVDFDALMEAGAVGFTDDGIPIKDPNVVRLAMEKAKALDVPLSFHEEDPELITDNGINHGKASEFYGIVGSPREAEISMVERDLKLGLETGAKVNVQHISAKESVALIREAKMQGGDIHAEATPHHFSLTEEAVIKYGTLGKMNPPLREESDRLAIIQGLQDGTIDIIATDHAPHTKLEKEKSLKAAPSGIIGLETALALGNQNLVNSGYLTTMELMEKMSYNPANLYQLQAGYLAEGGLADLVIYDSKEEWVASEYASKSTNSPFTGQTMMGKVKATICNGKFVYEEWKGR